MGIVTYLPRWLPVFFLSRKSLPEWFMEWLDLIPVAILSALIFSDLFLSGSNSGSRSLQPVNLKSLAAVPTLCFALKTKSLGGTVIVGMLTYWLLEKLF